MWGSFLMAALFLQMCLQNMVRLTVTREREQKSYTLDQLLELQNKLMLLSTKGEQGREQVSRFTEVSEAALAVQKETSSSTGSVSPSALQVFEGVRRLGVVLLRMQTSGNVLFRSWGAEVQCCPCQQPCIRVAFQSLAGREMVYHGEVTEQLGVLTDAMEVCQKEWRSLVGELRSRSGLLNLYTSEQMVLLCRWVLRVQGRASKVVPPLLQNLLLPIMPRCTLEDIRSAYSRACKSHVEQEPPASRGRTAEEDLMQFSSDEDDDSMEHDGIGENGEGGLKDLWLKFKLNMGQFLTQHLDVSTLASFLSHLSGRNQQHVVRSLPSFLQEGKPNLVLCPNAEVFATTVGVYAENPELPLPSADEVLVCREETTEEEVEIFLRRALCQGSLPSWRKIYCLVNPGLLGYDVSVAFGEFFELLKRNAGPSYHLVIISPVEHQHRYVPSFFSTYKVQAGVSPPPETVRTYLRHHFAQNAHPRGGAALASPGGLSVWMVSSERPAVGKSDSDARPVTKTRRKQEGLRIRVFVFQENPFTWIVCLRSSSSRILEPSV